MYFFDFLRSFSLCFFAPAYFSELLFEHDLYLPHEADGEPVNFLAKNPPLFLMFSPPVPLFPMSPVLATCRQHRRQSWPLSITGISVLCAPNQGGKWER